MLLIEIAPLHQRLDRNEVIRFIDSWLEASTDTSYKKIDLPSHVTREVLKKWPALDHRIARRIGDYIWMWTSDKNHEHLPTLDDVASWVNELLSTTNRGHGASRWSRLG